MSGEVSGAGSVEAAAAVRQVVENAVRGVYALPGPQSRRGYWVPEVVDEVMRLLAAAGLLAAPVPAVDADEVEAVARVIRDQRVKHRGSTDRGRSVSGWDRADAEAVLATLAPIRAAEVAAAEARGRLQGFADASVIACRDWSGDADAPPEHVIDARAIELAKAIQRLADEGAPVPTADADEELRQRLTRIFDLENAGDDPWRLDLMAIALSTHVTEAEERGRRAGLIEAARSLNTDPSAVVVILQDDARREMAEHRSRLADETAPTTSDEGGLT